jgi:nitroreductase
MTSTSLQSDQSELSPIDAGSAASVEAAIRTRRSTRAFVSKPVEKELLKKILIMANQAPSGSNIQPWRVYVLAGKTLKRVGATIKEAFLTSEPGHKRDYAYYTEALFEPYLGRRRACGWGMYNALGIETDKMKQQRAQNYEFFGAPVGLIFTIERRLERGSWIDCGMFVQNIMLLARHFGLHTCPQASLGEFPDIVRAELGIPQEQIILGGMSLGYADPDAIVNRFQPLRDPLSSFVTYWD